MIADTRCRNLRAVSALVLQIGSRTPITSAVDIWSTRLPPKLGFA